MDTVPQRRRTRGAGEPEGEAAAYEAAYQTALSQAGGPGFPSPTGVRGEASPSSLEMGQGTGIQESERLPVANPFHSERIQTEIQLIRNRPVTLDEDGQRLAGGAEGAFHGGARESDLEGRSRLGNWADDQGAEPDYTSAFTEGDQGGPRVARVEAGTDTGGPPSQSSFPTSPVDAGRLATVPIPEAVEKEKIGSPEKVTSDAPAAEEELVPDSGTSNGMEVMLMQILEENRSLKRRLDQLSLAAAAGQGHSSHSSWHSGTPGEPLLAGGSPVSFAADGMRGPELGAEVLSSGRMVAVQSQGPQQGASPQHFPIARGQGFQANQGCGTSLESRNLLEWRVGNPVEPNRGPSAGLQGVHGVSELVPYVAPTAQPISSPLPRPTGPELQGTQTMRQFAAQALDATGGFHTPRSSQGCTRNFDENGYPLSPGGTVIRPPPLPPPAAPRGPTALNAGQVFSGGSLGMFGLQEPGCSGPELGAVGCGQCAFPCQGYGGFGVSNAALPLGSSQLGGRPVGSVSVGGLPFGVVGPGGSLGDFGVQGPSGSAGSDVKPEEPARYISELPKLVQADLSTSAVVCGNWLAQIRQIFQGLSPSADIWFSSVEDAASQGYSRWLTADPLGRVGLDPASIVASFDQVRFQRVESRAVSLLLAALPQAVRDDVITNRWLTTSSILFRVLCLFQPGGASERALLLSTLVQPESMKSFKEALAGLRRWQQNLVRAQEVRATLPDASLLLRGIDNAVSGLLASNPMVSFRVNAFRHRVALDYNPTTQGVIQLVRLLQAESEAAALVEAPGGSDKRAKAASLTAAREPPPVKAPSVAPVTSPAPSAGTGSCPVVAAANAGVGEIKGKGKGKSGDGGASMCFKFADGSGCKFGDACNCKHDRARARREGKCLACGQSGHFRDCPLVAPENRHTTPDSGSDASPKAPGAKGGPGPKGKAKAKASAQAKGVTEEDSLKGEAPGNSAGSQSSGGNQGSPVTKEALLAEAAKLLKGVSIKAVRVEDLDVTWLRSALISASDPSYCLVDSGATNALRPASEGELEGCRVIRVDLASGGTDLRVNEFGTLLHTGQCQVILPASYLVELGYSISWKRRGCKIRHPKEGNLPVQVVKGCPLISKETGLAILARYEEQVKRSRGVRALEVHEVPEGLEWRTARDWLQREVRKCVGELPGEGVQWNFLRAWFPGITSELLSRVCVRAGSLGTDDWSRLPWNRRLRRSIDRGGLESLLVCCTPRKGGWKGCGRVLQLPELEKGLGDDLVFGHLLRWAASGVIGGVVGDFSGKLGSSGQNGLVDQGLAGETGTCCRMVSQLRFLLLLAVAQAAKDQRLSEGSGEGLEYPQEVPPEGIVNPEELVQWALARAAARLRPSDRAQNVSREEWQPIFVAWDLPDWLRKGCNHVTLSWSCEELKSFEGAYGFQGVSVDHGIFGLGRSRVSRLCISSWFLFERVEGHGKFLGTEGPSTGVPEVSQGWPWLLQALVQVAWVRWRDELENLDDVQDRRILLSKLSEKARYDLHVANDHSPYLKGCPVCVQAQGRRRSHWRTGFPSIHSASFDIAGPFTPGCSFDPVASGRDRGGGYKYFLACSYAAPKGYGPLDLDEGPEQGGDGAGFDGLLKAVTHRVREKRPEDPEGGVGFVDWGEDEFPKELGGRCNLFMGVPLRTKGGKEVLGHVQSMINRLETQGYPVHRYHADRAQELRSGALVGWLREKGISPSWTPGEAPAGNHAELAVQNLKAGIRKLLLSSMLQKQWWPLALLHISTRNWIGFAEAAGISQPPLLAFGTAVEARKRTKTGFAHQWQARTVQGLYVGQAPSTPGGHLVLVADGETQKVLLTSTVFPVRTGSADKPKYRLKSKRSSFVVRVLAAATPDHGLALLPVTMCTGTRTPGGESHGSERELFLRSCCGTVWASGDEGGADSGSESEARGEFQDENRQEDPHMIGKNVGDSTERAVDDDSVEDWVLGQGEYSAEECYGVLRQVLGNLPKARRPMLEHFGKGLLCGLYAVGGFRGVSKFSEKYSFLVEYLNRFLEVRNPGGLWTTIYISQNTCMPPHRDLRNASGFPIAVTGVGSFKGGGLWLEDEAGPTCRSLPDGSKRPGSVHGVKDQVVCFSGTRWHASEEWIGDRWILSAFVPRDFRSALEESRAKLRSLRFPLDRVESQGCLEESPTVNSVSLVEEVWEVELPDCVRDLRDLSGWVNRHSCIARLCKVLSDEIGDWTGDAEGLLQVARQLRVEESYRDYLEQVLWDCWVDEDSFGSLRALGVEVPLVDQPESGSEQFLQTRKCELSGSSTGAGQMERSG